VAVFDQLGHLVEVDASVVVFVEPVEALIEDMPQLPFVCAMSYPGGSIDGDVRTERAFSVFLVFLFDLFFGSAGSHDSVI
jgi:hypothetical protein